MEHGDGHVNNNEPPTTVSALGVGPDQPVRSARAGPGRHILFLFQESLLYTTIAHECEVSARVGCADSSGPVLCADAALLIFSRNDYNMDVRAFIAMVSMHVTTTRLAVLFVILPARVCDRCNVSHTSYY